MQVRDAMAKTIRTAAPEGTIGRVAALMKQEDCGFIPVLPGNDVVGMVTDRDLVLRGHGERAGLASRPSRSAR